MGEENLQGVERGGKYVQNILHETIFNQKYWLDCSVVKSIQINEVIYS